MFEWNYFNAQNSIKMLNRHKKITSKCCILEKYLNNNF
ncbi:hypothetical protein MNB_SUP05-SYMBIONT-7-77 [hydrothermal vent metagenome]|uniref:Uncharacterized protein n=1 Tax=hydrothermal vent metagenome TaxID=652676 RepID=A0A1W1E455_9ZZZZ